MAQQIVFRETNPPGIVIVSVDGRQAFANPEYRTSAEWAQRTYRLSDDVLLDMYADYKRDCEERGL